MSHGLIGFFARLSGRERAMIAVLVAFVLPFALIQGVALPLIARQEAARAAVIEAEALRDWLSGRQEELARLPTAVQLAQMPPDVAPVGLSGIEGTLIEAGLRDAVARLENPSGNSVALRFDEVSFTRLMTWLDTAETGLGYTVSVLRIARGALPGIVAAELQMEPRQ